jgi:hypothetical protein
MGKKALSKTSGLINHSKDTVTSRNVWMRIIENTALLLPMAATQAAAASEALERLGFEGDEVAYTDDTEQNADGTA